MGRLEGPVQVVPHLMNVDTMTSEGQGLTLVYFSAQPEPFLTRKYTLNTP